MYQNQKKPTLRRLFDKFVEGVGTCLSCAVVGAAIGFGIKAGCNLADAAAEALDDYLDPIDLDDDDLDEDEDEDDDEVKVRYPHLKDNIFLRSVDGKIEKEEQEDDENLPEADGVTPAAEVEKMVAVTFPARDSKGRFVKKTIVPAPESAEEAEEPAESEEADQEAEASTQPEQTEAPATEETDEPTAEENQQ